MSWRSTSSYRDAAVIAALAALTPGRARAQQDPASVEITVTAAPQKRDPGSVTVSTEQARRVAGTGGDALKVTESLPGVTRTAFDGGKVVVWGAAPGDTHVYVDGIEVPVLYHGGGLRGVVSADLVQSLDLVPGSYGADFGRGLGGLVRLRTKELPEEGFHATASADLLDAGAMVTGAFAGRVRVAVAARASYLDRMLSRVVSADVGDFVPIPRYHDYQAKVSVALRGAESVDLLLLGSGDALDRTVVSTDPARTRRESTETSFHRAAIRYSRRFEDGTSIEITPFVGLDHTSLDTSSGAVPARRDDTAWKHGLRASCKIPLASWLDVSAGLDALGSSASLYREGSLTIPPREGDLYVFGETPGADVASDRWSTNILDVAPYVSADIRIGPVTLTPGLRVDAFLIEGSRSTPRAGDTPVIGFSRMSAAPDPRVAVAWRVNPALTLSAAAGLYHQAPDPEDLSAVSGTPALGLQRAVHMSAGESLRILEGLSLDLTGFYRSLDHLVVRSRLANPMLAQSLTQDGQGRSYGLQVMLRRQLANGFLGWVAYTASRSERRYVGDPGYRLFDEDRTHVLSLVASYERAGWSGGARFRYTTGAPRTPVIGSFYDTTSGAYEPELGAQNSIRLPAFYQLDLRLAKKLVWSRAAVEIYLDALNVTFHKNAEEIAYSYDYRKHDYITGLPILAVLGARLEI